MHKYKILGLIANHTYDNIKYNISLSNISIIKKYINNICIIDSSNEHYANLLKKDLTENTQNDYIKNYFQIPNDNYFDFGKWVYCLNNINYNDYDYILFLNDSIILTQDIDKYFLHIHYTMSEKINLFAYNDSTQFNYHYQSYLFLISNRIIPKFINFFESKRPLIYNIHSLVHHMELNMCNIDPEHDCYIKIANSFNMDKNLYWENEVLYQYLLSKDIFGVMKLKKIIDDQSNYKINIYSHNIENFDYDFYRKNYNDLTNLNNNELLDHFVRIGQYEGRRFSNINQYYFLPYYYRDKLDKLGLLYFFDIPHDFDVYNYKKLNIDLHNFSVSDAMKHYLKSGCYEGRIYNNSYTSNIYINNFIINMIFNLKNINNIIIPESFNIMTYLLFNNLHDKYGYIGVVLDYNLNKHKNIKLYSREDFLKHSADLNVEHYKNIHNLKNLNTMYILQHYLYNKVKDNILFKLPSDFDINIYKKIYNNELKNLSDNEVYNHYINNDNNKIYKLPDDFNYKLYKKIYKDLDSMTKNELEEHYLVKGYRENRIYKIDTNFNLDNYKLSYTNINNLNINEINSLKNNINNNYLMLPDDFDHTIYKIANKDLEDLNKEQLENHYIKYGKEEGRIYKLPIDFKVNEYRKYNPELNNLTDIELKEHYLLNGINENRLYSIPDDFNYELYKYIYNNDLKDLNNEELIYHYMTFGYKDGRIYKLPNDFNIDNYRYLYDDIKDLSDEEAMNHYIKYGVKEKRIYKLPKDFDEETYKNIYSDVKHLSSDEIKEHYMNYGFIEKRIYKIPDDFNLLLYKKIYTDLSDLNDNELKDHYLYTGLQEGRIYKIPDDFDTNVYKSIYSDLNNLNELQLQNHYLIKGIKENRIYRLPDDFDTDMYSRIYDDLEDLDEESLIMHYLKYGANEKRIYKLPDDFDPIQYKTINKELSGLTNEQLKEHYLFIGVLDNKLYKIPYDFDPFIYKSIYKDLRNLSDENVKKHYLSNGINENRIYKLTTKNNFDNYVKNLKNIKNIDFVSVYELLENKYGVLNENYNDLYDEDLLSNNIEKNIEEKVEKLTKLPDDFDYIMYKKIYKDLSHMDKIELSDHYLNYGYYEKRLYKLPKDFNPDIYKKLNVDLQSLSTKQLVNHFIYDGIYEKRKYKEMDNIVNNDKIINKNLNVVLKNSNKWNNIKNDNEIEEEIIINEDGLPSDFKSDIYKKLNKDLEHLDTEQLIQHYLNHGKIEKRIYKEKIVKQYNLKDDKTKNTLQDSKTKNTLQDNKTKNINTLQDNKTKNTFKNLLRDNKTKNISKNELEYNNMIEIEEEITINEDGLPSDFKPDIYKKLNKDLEHLDTEQLIQHYLNHGKIEKRIYKEKKIINNEIIEDDNKQFIENDINENNVLNKFNKSIINKKKLDNKLNVNKNIFSNNYNKNENVENKNNTNSSLYFRNNINENNIYNKKNNIIKNKQNKLPTDFNHDIYKKIYRDVENLDDTELEEHYLLIGMKQHRIYNIPNDFDPIFYKNNYDDINELNIDELKEHYLRVGYNQNRLYKFPNDFNANRYKNLNNDLLHLNETELINHFINHGIKEKREYK